MVTTEFALCRVKHDQAIELEALRAMRSAPGVQAIHHALAEEDSTKMLWVIGRLPSFVLWSRAEEVPEWDNKEAYVRLLCQTKPELTDFVGIQLL